MVRFQNNAWIKSIFAPGVTSVAATPMKLFLNCQEPFLKHNKYRQPTEYPHFFWLLKTNHVFEK
jgi:hypothetical protein